MTTATSAVIDLQRSDRRCSVLLVFAVVVAGCTSTRPEDSAAPAPPEMVSTVHSESAAPATTTSTLGTTSVLVPAAPDVTASPPSAAPSSDPPPTTATCASVRASTSVLSDGRTTLVELPATNEPAAVVVALHGYKGTPQGLAHYSSLNALADSGNAFIIYPEGSALDLGFGWNSGAAKFATRTGDDVAVLLDSIAIALSLPCADPSRVVLVGESNGGGMALRSACDGRMSAVLRSIVLVNPAIDSGVMATCAHPDRSISVMAVAGHLDRVVPYDGSRPPFLAAEQWFDAIARNVSGCTAVSAPRLVSDQVAANDGSGCRECATLYSIADGGHTWPGAVDAVNGAAIGTFALTDAIAEIVTGRLNLCGG